VRDLRAKAGTDKAEFNGDIMLARSTWAYDRGDDEQYIRTRMDKKVTPSQ
jgi:hypothetical protein